MRRIIEYFIFEMIYDRDYLLSMKLLMKSWKMMKWEKIKMRKDLIVVKMRQLNQRRVFERYEMQNLRNSRKVNKTYFDVYKRLRLEKLQSHINDLILVHETQNFDRNKKMKLIDK